jgi:hypothetical protein
LLLWWTPESLDKYEGSTIVRLNHAEIVLDRGYETHDFSSHPVLLISVFTSDSSLLYTSARPLPCSCLRYPQATCFSHIHSHYGVLLKQAAMPTQTTERQILMCWWCFYYNPHIRRQNEVLQIRNRVRMPFPFDEDLSKYTTFKPHQCRAELVQKIKEYLSKIANRNWYELPVS